MVSSSLDNMSSGRHRHERLHLDATRRETVQAHSRRRSRTEQSHDHLSASNILLPNSYHHQYTPQRSSETAPALKLARQAPMAGYLNKLGGNVRQFKRRFFVLQPTTTLYYFLSPDDEEPRGCLDLEGATIVPQFDDSVYQFAIHLPNEDDELSNAQNSITLEARSEHEANEWIRALQNERMDVVQENYQRAQRAISGYKSRIAELEQSLDDCKLVEADRDGALEDAANWKAQFESLDEGIRQYAQSMRHVETNEEESNDDDENEQNNRLEPANVPGRHFSTLWNTVEQMKENLTLASNEANTAIEDVKMANATVQTLEKRMAQAETHLCKIWEENCELRKVIKQHKREKRVLVKEVKALRELQREDHEGSCGDEEEQKLLDDIEAHVQTSIQLQRELVGNRQDQDEKHQDEKQTLLNISAGSDESEGIVGRTLQLSCGPKSLDGSCSNTTRRHAAAATTKIHLASLMDDDEEEDDSDSSASGIDEKHAHGRRDPVSVGSGMNCQNASQSADGDYSERSNPIGKLDDIHLHDDATPPKLIAVSSSSNTIQSRRPTSQLACPLADVVSSTNGASNTTDGEVYHLTFYSRKIGLQFQKVPPPPIQAKGLLTEAMTTDLKRVVSASEKTAAELRRIANLSGNAKTDHSNEMSCQVAKPIDAVLVCGFVGFDDSSGNKRPKLGARLVAFDGVSLEAGAWTFQSVRKAIQARRRPLTLSFRNDFLTTAQRKILTKAVKDMENLSPSTEVVPGTNRHQTQQATPSSQPSSQRDDELSSATGSSTGLGHQSESSAASFSKFRSFSEAGSSVSVLSAVGPLVSNLLAQRREPFTPEYLRRPSVSIEESPHHLDFKADLL